MTQERAPRGGRKVKRYKEHTKGTSSNDGRQNTSKGKRLATEEKRENRKRREKKLRRLRRVQKSLEQEDKSL